MELTAENHRGRGFTGTDLKLAAMAFMFIDHIGAIILERCFVFTQTGEINSSVYAVDMILRLLGRIAFPIFCFLLVEGFVHTRNRKKYLRSLLIFSVISEIPFNIALSGSIFFPQNQNVFFTLSIGLIAMELYGRLFNTEKGDKKRLAYAFGIAACLLVAQLLRADYGFFGVALILIFYVLRGSGARLFFVAGVWLFIGSAILNTLLYPAEYMSLLRDYGFSETLLVFLSGGITEVFGILSFGFLAKYNGERGTLPFSKYLFYIFYPVHLFILGIIAGLIQFF